MDIVPYLSQLSTSHESAWIGIIKPLYKSMLRYGPCCFGQECKFTQILLHLGSILVLVDYADKYYCFGPVFRYDGFGQFRGDNLIYKLPVFVDALPDSRFEGFCAIEDHFEIARERHGLALNHLP